jgi:ABC-type thiamine transport system ATPase subunit
VAKEVQQKVHRRIAAVVTRCLAAVFDDAPTFEIEFVQRRGKTEAVLWLVRDSHRTDPREDSGGVRDVVSLALRLAKLLMERPARRKLLVLDEPYRNIHGDENRARAAALIQALSKEMKVQFLIVTGLDWLKVGKVIQL